MATTKKFLQAAAGAAGGAAEFTAIEDVFSTYLYTGNGTAQVIENGINLGAGLSSGSVEFLGSDYLQADDNTALGSNDFTIECWVKANSNISTYSAAFHVDAGGPTNYSGILFSKSGLFVSYNGTDWDVFAAATGTWADGSWHHIAVSRNGSSLKCFLDGVQQSDTAISTNSIATSNAGNILIGDQATSGDYIGYISDFRLVRGTGLYTANFTPPTSALTAVSGTALLTCQGPDPLIDNSGNNLPITVSGGAVARVEGPLDGPEAGQGGLVWTKNRSVVYSHHLFDTERGVNRRLRSDTTEQELLGSNSLTSFNANGFSLKQNGIVNTSGNDYASFTFRKAPRFFDVVTYTGDGTSGKSLSHNLGVEPGVVIIKKTDAAANWYVYHRDIGTGEYLQLNLTDAKVANSSYFVSASSTDFVLGANGSVNGNGQNHVAYLFAHDPLGPSGDGSDGLIACGSYTGNGSLAGPEVNLGWEPQWLLIKNASGTGGWVMHDSMRGFYASGSSNAYFQAQVSDAEASVGESVFPTPTGFKLNSTFPGWNTSGNTYVYIAIRRGPMRVPTSGTEVFAIDNTNASPAPSLTSGFPVDLGIMGYRSGGGFYWADRMRGAKELTSSSTAAEASASVYQFDFMDGFLAASGIGSDANYMLRRAPNFFDVVAYTGDGVAGRTVPHNLGVAPEMMIVKKRNNTTDWAVYTAPTGSGEYLELNTTAASDTTNAADYWNNTNPAADVFTLGTTNRVNNSGDTYIAYLFASLDGISKVGSYTGNGASQTIDCGFTSGARFVLIKRTSGASDWYVFDTARGIVSGTDPYLNINSSAAENQYGLLDFIDPDGSGFIADNNYAGTNQSGESYIFLAIA